MIRQSPAQRYIKFLLSHPDKYSVTAVRDIIRGQSLDWPSESYAEHIRDRFDTPIPFQPTNRLHKRSQQFLLQHQIVGFYHPDKHDAIAHKLLQRPKAKELIETMSLAFESPAMISVRAQQAFVACTPEAVRRYQFFYFDMNLVDSLEMNALLQLRVEHLSHGNNGVPPTPDEQMQYAALRKVSYRDPRRLVADMPVTPMACMLNQLRMGLMPSAVELGRLAAATRAGATARALEAVILGGPHGGENARDYALAAKAMTELLNELGSPDALLQKELQKFVLETERIEVPHIHELSQGSHTEELSPAVQVTEIMEVTRDQ